jgi:hypothetical protein
MNFFKSSCKTQDISATTHKGWVLDWGVRLLTSFGGRAAEYSGTGHAVYGGMPLKMRVSLSTMSSSSTSPPGIRDVSLLSGTALGVPFNNGGILT